MKRTPAILSAILLAAASFIPAAGTTLDEELARPALDNALICMATYDIGNDCEVTGWKGPAYQFGSYDFREGRLGLHAGVYSRQTKAGGNEAVLAFRGTEVDKSDDWLTDLSNFWGLVPDAYLDAGKFAQAARRVSLQQGCQSLTLTGHSLGGGLASYAGLLIGAKATCFGSAALGEGMQQVLWREASPQLDDPGALILHIFKYDDIVPPLTASNGRHFGTIATPALRSPPDYAALTTPEEKIAYFAISGYLSKKWLRQGAKVAFSQIMEGHGIDQYVAGLAGVVSPPGDFSPAGEWLSTNSFFDVTSTQTRFRFCRNGRFFVINDIRLLDLARGRISDSGDWRYQQPYLSMTIPKVARLTYELTGGDGGHVTEWKRLKMEPDLVASPSATPEERNAAKASSAMMNLVLKRMEGKTVLWTMTPPSPPPADPSPSR